MILVLGIDAGGTQTTCQLADGRGHVRAEARGAGANLQADGELAVEKVLHDVMDRTLAAQEAMPAAICLGMAGVDREEDARTVRGIMARIGHKARVLVVNDALIALEAGVGDGPGVVIVAGTGSIAYGRNERGEAARAGGWGHVLGDEGSGYWMGRRALGAVIREADRRGPPTALTPRLLTHFHVDRPQGLVHEIYGSGARPTSISALAAFVGDAAAAGDAVARDIIATGAQALAAGAEAVARRLSLTDRPLAVVLSGGVFRGVPLMLEEIKARVGAALPGARVARLAGEPAAGAVRLALAEASGGARLPVYLAD